MVLSCDVTSMPLVIIRTKRNSELQWFEGDKTMCSTMVSNSVIVRNNVVVLAMLPSPLPARCCCHASLIGQALRCIAHKMKDYGYFWCWSVKRLNQLLPAYCSIMCVLRHKYCRLFEHCCCQRRHKQRRMRRAWLGITVAVPALCSSNN